MTIVAFLTAQLDEAEGMARALPTWMYGYDSDGEHFIFPGRDALTGEVPPENLPDRFDGWHRILDRETYLADIAAKRQIIAYISLVQADAGEPPHFDPDDAAALTHILRLLALPFADRPGYDEAWRS